MARRLVLTLALTLALTGTARADMTWEFASLVARDYWQDKGYTVPCQPRLVSLTAREGNTVARALGVSVPYMFSRGCEVWTTPTAEGNRSDPGLAWAYCLAVVHEYGHLAGLGHEYGGIMSEDGGAPPFGCAHPRQYKVLKGWRKPPRWVRRSPARVERLWLSGRVWRAQVARARWLERR